MEKVRILSFDPGTANMGYAILEGNMTTEVARLTAHWGVLKTAKKDGDIRARADKLGADVKRLIQCFHIDYIAIEDYTEQGVKSGKTYKDMSILIEHMRMVCRDMGFEARIRTNAEWKTIAVGVGGLNKAQVQHFVRHKVEGTEFLGSSQSATHVWDAVGIGYAEFKMILQGE